MKHDNQKSPKEMQSDIFTLDFDNSSACTNFPKRSHRFFKNEKRISIIFTFYLRSFKGAYIATIHSHGNLANGLYNSKCIKYLGDGNFQYIDRLSLP